MQNGASQNTPGVAGPSSQIGRATTRQQQQPRLPRAPGRAVRATDTPPVPPPRPESTLSANSRPIVPVKNKSANIPSLPPRPQISIPVETSPRIPSPAPVGSISLTSPRPTPNRTQNLYVDAPLKSPPGVIVSQPTKHQPGSRPGSIPLPQSTSKRVNESDFFGKRPLLLASQQLSSVIPNSSVSTLKKSTNVDGSDFDSVPATESIICRECGRCRCKACREPRRLPEQYLCHKKCLCSPETVVDTVSCMCLVKALFYHCGKDYIAEVDSVFENPCSCSGEYVGARWGCMAALSLCMPCLLCYLPMKGCAKACEAVYSRCATIGCRCESKAVPTTSDDTFVNSRNNNIDEISLRSGTVSPGSVSPVDSEKRLLSET